MTDHVRGDRGVELLVYADFQCPYCRDAQPALRRVLARLPGRVRLRFRHFPIEARHPRALAAAHAAEAAGAQERFWEMHDLLYAHQDALEDGDLAAYARELGLDADRFDADRRAAWAAEAVAGDREAGREAGVQGTPAFFVAGEPHRGFYDVESLVDALEDAGA